MLSPAGAEGDRGGDGDPDAAPLRTAVCLQCHITHRGHGARHEGCLCIHGDVPMGSHWGSATQHRSPKSIRKGPNTQQGHNQNCGAGLRGVVPASKWDGGAMEPRGPSAMQQCQLHPCSGTGQSGATRGCSIPPGVQGLPAAPGCPRGSTTLPRSMSITQRASPLHIQGHRAAQR